MKRSVLARSRVPVATMDPYEVIRRPRVSEKSTALRDEHNTYVFEVAPEATKTDVREAVVHIWNVKVESVRIVNIPGKARRMGRLTGFTRSWKKAVVKLAKGDGIDVLR